MANQIQKALVVDDEAALREIVKEVLSFMDIECLAAENGTQAIELASESADSIDLFIIDMFMPMMSGEETFAQLNQMIPGCPAIFMSGYEKDSETISRSPGTQLKFLKKPFSIGDLKLMVESLF